MMAPALIARTEDGIPVAVAGPERQLPRLRSIPLDFKPFVDDVARRRDVNAAMRGHEDAERRRTAAAKRPLVVIPPRKMADVGPRLSGLYTPAHWPQRLPGRDRWPAEWSGIEDTAARQEASFLTVMRPRVKPGATTLEGAEVSGPTGEIEIDESGRVRVGEDARLTVPHDAEPQLRRHVLDPTGRPELEAAANARLRAAGSTIVGTDRSDETRGLGVDRSAECARRARIHARDLDSYAHRVAPIGPGSEISLDGLRAPYRPRFGMSDELREYRAAVAISLKLEGFSTATIARVLNRADSKIELHTRGVKPMVRKPTVTDNWYRVGTDGNRRADAAGDWRRERAEIQSDLRRVERGDRRIYVGGRTLGAGSPIYAPDRERYFGRTFVLSSPDPSRQYRRAVSRAGRRIAPALVRWDDPCGIREPAAAPAPRRVIDRPRTQIVVSDRVRKRLEARLDALHRRVFGADYPAYDDPRIITKPLQMMMGGD